MWRSAGKFREVADLLGLIDHRSILHSFTNVPRVARPALDLVPLVVPEHPQVDGSTPVFDRRSLASCRGSRARPRPRAVSISRHATMATSWRIASLARSALVASAALPRARHRPSGQSSISPVRPTTLALAARARDRATGRRQFARHRGASRVVPLVIESPRQRPRQHDQDETNRASDHGENRRRISCGHVPACFARLARAPPPNHRRRNRAVGAHKTSALCRVISPAALLANLSTCPRLPAS